MPQGIVDLFESIQIDEGHSQLFIVSLGLTDGLTQKLVEETAIGQRSEAIMISKIFDT